MMKGFDIAFIISGSIHTNHVVSSRMESHICLNKEGPKIGEGPDEIQSH